MTRSLIRHAEAVIAVAAVAGLTQALLPVLGLTSAALLFLLPVLLAAVRGGVVPGMVAALTGAAAYNYFLLEPRYTFRVHQLDNLVSVFVLGAVAVVTSRLATQLLARETEANQRARASDEAAQLSALLAAAQPEEALADGVAFVAERYGTVRLTDEVEDPAGDAGFSSLDLSARAWASHNGDMTGHGTDTMAAADWTFVPLAPKTYRAVAVAAIARPADGSTRTAQELVQLRQLCQLLGQCRDRASLEQVRRERELLERTDRLRRTFLASLAHDFRTPLTVLGGRLEMLARRDPEAEDALAAARRLDRMMADLIGAARLEEGSLQATRDSLDLVDVASALCDTLVLPQGLHLERAIPPDLPFVAGDAVLLHHVLVNLVDNAIRHARGQVALSAKPGDKCIVVAVDDDGPGVPAEARRHVFERFRRLEGSDRTEGSGLGLAIAKGFAEAMSGRLEVVDSPLGGARFELSLPLAEGHLP